MSFGDLASRANELINQGYGVLATKVALPHGGNNERVDAEMFNHWKVASLSFLRRVFGTDSPHFTSFQTEVASMTPFDTSCGVGVLRAAQGDIQSGYLTTLQARVTADIFTDLLDMGEYLLDEGFKDPAASLIGAVLEDSLRKIASVHNIPFQPRDGLDVLSNKIASAQVYNPAVKAQVNAWRVIRNAADHGNFGEYDLAMVKSMLFGVREFLAKYL